jgi:hypothetical protein
MLAAAAATAAVRRELNDLSGTAVRSSRSTSTVQRDISNLEKTSKSAGKEIDRLSGRMRIFADLALIVGPSLAPIGAVGVPAVAGLANQFGFAALAAITAKLAFKGIGDTLTAVNKAAIEPTAENIAKAHQAMQMLSPAGRDMVRQLQSMRPLIDDLRDSASGSMFPGLIEGLESLERLAPRVEGILGNVGKELGKIASRGADSLTGPRWAEFFSMLATEAKPTLRDLASAIGSLTHGLAQMWIDFSPLNRDFGSWLADAARGFDKWATGLDQTAGFQEFVEYIRTNGPRVADTAIAVGNAIIEIVEAVAPLGGPSLKIIETFANALAKLADSDIGTPILGAVAALALLNRTLQVTGALQTRLTGSTAITSGVASGGLFGFMATGARSASTNISQLRTDLRTMANEYRRTSQVTRTVGPSLFGPTPLGASRTYGYTKGGRATGALGSLSLSAISGTSGAAQRTRATIGQIGSTAGKTAALVGALTLATTGLGDSFGLSNTAMLGMAGTMAGPWGAAAGAGVGLMLDLAAANDDVSASLDNVNALLAGGAGFTQLSAGLKTARGDVTGFQDDVNGFMGSFSNRNNPFDSDFWDVKGQLAATKNTWEGIFGKSDVEEAREEYDLAADAVKNAEGAARGLADVMGVDIFGSQTAQLQQLDRVIQQAQPAMDRLGITQEDLRAAFAVKDAKDGTLFGSLVRDGIGDYDKMTAAINRANRAISRSEKNAAIIQAQDQAARNAAASFLNYSDAIVKGKFNLDDYLKQLEKQARAQQNFENNIEELGERGLSEAATNQLRNQGAAGMQAAEALANGSAAAIRRFNRVVRQGQDTVRHFGEDTVSELRAAKTAFASLPKDVRTKIKADGIPQTEAEVDHLVDKYDLTEKERRALITLKDLASGQIQQVLRLLAAADGAHAESTITITTIRRQQYEYSQGGNQAGDTSGGAPDIRGGTADGGTIPGARHPYRDKVLASLRTGGSWALAPGEEVTSNRYGQADVFRRELKAINNWRPGMPHPLAPRASERPLNSGGGGGGVTRHVVEVRVVGGEFDLTHARAQIDGIARVISQDTYDQNRTWEATQGG